MRKFVFLFVLGVLVAACGSKTNEYTVNGTIEGVSEGQAVLQKIESTGPVAVDSTQIVDGQFTFSGTVEHPELYLVFVEDNQMPVAFFLEQGDIEINASIDSMQQAEVEGSELNKKFKKFNDEVPSRERSEELQQAFMEARQGGDQEQMQELAQEYQVIMQEQQQYFKDFVHANSDNAVGAFLAMNMANGMEPSELNTLIASFEESIPNHPYVEELKSIKESMQQQPSMPQQPQQQQQQQQQQQEEQSGE